MTFSVKTEYALRALYAIAESPGNEPIGRIKISAGQNIPIHYLEQILISLKKAGLITSRKGPGGGYALALKISAITLWDVYMAVDHREVEGTACFPGYAEECEHLMSCNVKGIWFSLHEIMKNSMSQLKLDSILPSESKRRNADLLTGIIS